MIGPWIFRLLETTNPDGDPIIRLEFKRDGTDDWIMLFEAVVTPDGPGPVG